MDLHVEQRGTGEPLVLVMGMSGNARHWGEPFLDALARDFAVTAFDNRGVGRSPRIDPQAEPFTIRDLAADTAAVLDRAGLADAHVVGISMGGMVAQELALAHPGRVRTLTLGCTFAGGATAVRTPAATLQRLGEAMTSGDRARAIRTGWEVNVSPQVAADQEQWAAFERVATAEPTALAVVMAQMQAIAAHDALDRLAGIAVPTLVVHGDRDEMLPVGNGRLIAETVPGARLEVLEGVGHMFWWEQPERSAALIAEHAFGGVRA